MFQLFYKYLYGVVAYNKQWIVVLSLRNFDWIISSKSLEN